jgi:hypothetical protein
MEPITIVLTTISTIFFTKALEKSGEKFGEAVMDKMGKSIAKISQHSPETAIALEAGNTKVLNLDRGILAQIPAEPIFAEFLVAVDADENDLLRQKLEEIQETASQNPNKLAEKIGILVQDGGRVDIKEFKM